MSDYTPREGEMRALYVNSTPPYVSDKEANANFNRFLRERDGRTAVRVLREAANDFQRWWPVYGDTWLRERADNIEKGATDDQS